MSSQFNANSWDFSLCPQASSIVKASLQGRQSSLNADSYLLASPRPQTWEGTGVPVGRQVYGMQDAAGS